MGTEKTAATWQSYWTAVYNISIFLYWPNIKWTFNSFGGLMDRSYFFFVFLSIKENIALCRYLLFQYLMRELQSGFPDFQLCQTSLWVVKLQLHSLNACVPVSTEIHSVPREGDDMTYYSKTSLLSSNWSPILVLPKMAFDVFLKWWCRYHSLYFGNKVRLNLNLSCGNT